MPNDAPQTTELDRLLAEASALAGGTHPCHILGHKWRHVGGSNCGCEGIEPSGERWQGSCSVPVHKCDGCGDYDYGQNPEAKETRAACAREMADG